MSESDDLSQFVDILVPIHGIGALRWNSMVRRSRIASPFFGPAAPPISFSRVCTPYATSQALERVGIACGVRPKPNPIGYQPGPPLTAACCRRRTKTSCSTIERDVNRFSQQRCDGLKKWGLNDGEKCK